MSLKNLPINERPRERLSRYGPEVLSAIELIAILLGSGTRNRSVLQLASDLLSHFGSIRSLSEASLPELQQVKGIGLAKAIQIHASFALARRVEEKQTGIPLDTTEKVYDFIRFELEDQKTEHLLIVLLDVRSCLIHREILSKGTLTELLMHPREIFHTAIKHRAHSFLLAHNHPSGNPSPSPCDLEMTHILLAASRVVGIHFKDHLILGKGDFVSLAKMGIFERKSSYPSIS